MVSAKTILFAGACAFTASATPIPAATGVCALTASATPVPAATGSTGINVTPEALTSLGVTACPTTGPYVAQCATASQAATAIKNSFAKYQITSRAEQIALIAYQFFESVGFKYNHNISPGRPGQGTRMMAMSPTIAKYAAVVADKNELSTAQAKGGDAGLEAVLALVNKTDDLSFGAAAWYLTTCTPAVRSGLQSGSLQGWHDFLTLCVQTTLTADRDVPWTQANTIFGSA